MGYFNFYVLKEIYKKNKKLINKFLIFFGIFIIVSLARSKCFAVVTDFPSQIQIDNYAFNFPTDNTNLNSAKNDFNYYLIQYYFSNYSSKIGSGFIYFSNVPLCFKERSNSWVFKGYNNETLTGSKFIPISFRNGNNSNNITISNPVTISTTGQDYIPVQAAYSTYPSTTRNVTSSTANYYQYLTGNYSLNFVNSSGQVIENVFSIETAPYITTQSSNITNWDFQTLDIDLGTTQSPTYDVLHFNYNGKDFIMSVLKYYLESQNIVKIPISDLNENIVFVEDATFKVEYYDFNSIGDTNPTIYDLGLYNITLDSATAGVLNDETDRTIQNNIYNEQQITNENLTSINETQQETNGKLDDLKDTMTDSTVEDSSIDLPTISVNDPTQAGIDQVFTQFYNAFCTGSASAIVFPIPNTNKNITLPGNFVYDMLHNNGGDSIINIITAFWWYTIGSWVVKDIWDKIFKIQEGEVENIQTSNIKADML